MYAKVEENIAIEISEEPQVGWEEAPSGITVGSLKTEGGWALPPAEVSTFQAKAALAMIGKLALAEAIIQGSGDVGMQLAWKEASVFRAESPSIMALAPLIGLSTAQLYQLFHAAANITA